MEIGSLLLILALAILVGLFVSRPFLEKNVALSASSGNPQDDHKRSTLMAERDRVLNALQELDFDYKLNKIPDEDYPGQRAALLQYGANILRQLDEMEPNKSRESNVTSQLERAVESPWIETAPEAGGSNNHSKLPVNGSPDDELEALLASRRRTRREKSAGFCPKCGGPVQKSDKFCPKCGMKIV